MDVTHRVQEWEINTIMQTNNLFELPPLDRIIRCISNPLVRGCSNISVLSDNEGAHFVPFGRGHYNIANENVNQDAHQKQNKNNYKNQDENEPIYVQSKCSPVDQQTKTADSKDKSLLTQTKHYDLQSIEDVASIATLESITSITSDPLSADTPLTPLTPMTNINDSTPNPVPFPSPNNMTNKPQIPINSAVCNNMIKPAAFYNNIMYFYLSNELNKMKRNNIVINNQNNNQNSKRSPSYEPLMRRKQQRQQRQQRLPSAMLHGSNNGSGPLQPPNRNSNWCPAQNRNNRVPNKWEICWEFNSKRGCKWGKSCYWKHAYYNR